MTDGPPSNRESRDEPSRRGSSSGKFDDGRRDLLGGTGDQSRFGGLSTVETHSADPNQADRLLWQFDDDTKFVSSPTIVGGTLFIGGTNARVYALDANNGTEVWEYNPGICIGCSNRSSPNVVNGTVYYGTWNGDGAVRGLDAATGEQEWYYSTTDDDVTASSLVYEGTVYSVDESGFIYAVDAESSEELWSIQIDTDPDMSPVVADGRIYMTERIDSTAGLSAFDASTGDRMWHRSNDGGEFRRVTVADGVLYASGYDGLNGELYAMDPADGDILGIGGFASNFSAVYRPPTVANGMLYVGGQYAREGILVAVDRDTLNYAWSFNPDEGDDDDPFHQESAPTVADGIVYMMAGKYDGTDWQSYLYAIDAVTGDEQWRYQLETQTGSTGFGYSSPTVVDGAVYIATHTNGVLALDADGTGTSEDSRVTLGTLGHHDGWTGSDPPESVSAEIDVSTGVVYPGETVTFDASNSKAASISAEWDFGDGTTATGLSVFHRYDTPGEYPVDLTVTSANSADTATTDVLVLPDGDVGFGVRPSEPVENENIAFEGVGAANYGWDFDDGTVATGERAVHSYSDAGTYSVTLAAGGETIVRDVEVLPADVSVDVDRENGGAPFEGIPYEETFVADASATAGIDYVKFTLGSEVKTDGGNDNWSATFDLAALDGNEVLTVTAVDENGNEATATSGIEVQEVPEWLQWLVDGDQFQVDEAANRIDFSYVPVSLSYSYEIDGVPIDLDPATFDGSTEVIVSYDTGQRLATLYGTGSVNASLFGAGFDIDGEISGTIDRNLQLVDANLAGSEQVQPPIVGPPFRIDAPGWVPCLDSSYRFETTVAPSGTLSGSFDDQLDFLGGEISSAVGIGLSAGVTLCGVVDAGIDASGNYSASFEIGTNSRNLNGSVSATGTAWFKWGPLETGIDVDVGADISSTTAMQALEITDDDMEWKLSDEQGPSPAPGIPSVHETDDAGTASSLHPTATPSGSYNRLTNREYEDVRPSVATTDSETVVVWSRQQENKDVQNGRDIAFMTDDGSGWSSAKLLTDDQRHEDAPVVAATSDGTLLAAWEYVDTDLSPDPSPADVKPNLEIAYAVDDGTGWSTPTVLTNSTTVQYRPTVASNGDGWLLAWESESGTGTPEIRYVEIATDGTAGTIASESAAMHPAVGPTSQTGAAIGHATLTNGTTDGVVSARVASGSKTDVQTFTASGVDAVTTGEDRIVWLENQDTDPRLFEGDRSAGTKSELSLRDAVVAVAEPTLTTDGSDAVLAYRAHVESAETRELVYRLDRGTGWIFDRQFVQAPDSESETQSLWRPAVTFGADGNDFETVFTMTDTTQAGKHDVFVATHGFGSDYAVAASGPDGVSDGQTVSLDYTVWNRGDLAGEQVDLVVENDTRVQATETVGPLAVDETVSGTVEATVDSTGTFDFRIDSGGTKVLVTPTPESEFESGATVLTVATPDLSVADVTPVTTETVAITLENDGGAAAESVPVEVSDGGTELATVTAQEIGAGETTTVEVTVDPAVLDPSVTEEIVIDPDETLPTAVSPENRTTATWLLQPDLQLTSDVAYVATINDGLVARVVVGNRNPVPGDATVIARREDGTRLGETTATIPGADGGTSYETVSVQVDATAITVGETLELTIDAQVPVVDPSATVIRDDVGPVFSSPVPLTQQWAYETGGRLQYSSPAVDDTRVYVGGLGESFYALARDPQSDQIEWVEPRDGSLSDSSPTLSNGLVFVGGGGGTLYAYDHDATDKTAWTYDIESAITSSPVVLNGTVYVGANDGTVHAVQTDGTVAWDTPVDVEGPVYSQVAAGNGLVYVTTNDGRVVALDGATGGEEWSFDTGTELGASGPAVANGNVYVGADRVYALDASTGDLVWNSPVEYGGTAGSTPTVSNGTVYVGSADGRFHALAADDGSTRWTFQADAGIATEAAVGEDRVAFASLAGTVYVLHAETGAVLASETLASDEIRSSPVMEGLDLYLGTEGGSVVDLRIDSGT